MPICRSAAPTVRRRLFPALLIIGAAAFVCLPPHLTAQETAPSSDAAERGRASLEQALDRPGVEKALDRLAELSDTAARFLVEIGGIPSPSGQEHDRAVAVAARMRASGLESVRVTDAPNVIGVIPGRSGRALVFVSTLDDLATVAEHQRAADGPPRIEGDRVVGPGTNTSLTTVAMLAAAEAYLAAGLQPEHDLVFAAVAQEETGLQGMKSLYPLYRDRAIGFVDILGEGRSISYGALGIHWWRVEASGPPGHTLRGGLPNVNQAIAQAVDRIFSLPWASRTDASDVSRTRLNISILESGAVYNHKPAEGWFSLDLRSMEAEIIARMEGEVTRVLEEVSAETGIALEMIPFQRTPGGRIPGALDSELVTVAAAISEYVGYSPRFSESGSANLNIAIAGGTPAIGLGGSRGGDRGKPTEWADIGALMDTARHTLLLAATLGGTVDGPHASTGPDGSVELWDGRVIPPLPELAGMREQFETRVRWLEEKHALLPGMMHQHGVDWWIVVSEEFHPDPVMGHVAPPLHYVRRRDVKVFVAGNDGLDAYSNYWRPTETYGRFFQPLPSARNERGVQDTAAGLRTLYERQPPRRIALNTGGRRGQDSGLTYDTRKWLAEALGPEAEARFVPAAALIEEYLETRIDGELDAYRKLVLATDVLAQRALSNLVIKPGVTRAEDLKWYFEQAIADLGVGGKPWFEIHTAVQRFDPETGRMIDYVHPAPDDLIYQQGDIIHLDTGFDYMGFSSDWQKVAYILREGETDVPQGLKRALANANRIHEAFADAPRPGLSGHDAAMAILDHLGDVDFTPSIYSHPIGHHGHGLGPAINARAGAETTRPAWDSILREGAYRSVEFKATSAVPEYGGGEVDIPMEDDAWLSPEGYRYFRPYQTEWYLIR